MKFEVSDMVAAGAVVLAVVGFAWGIKQNNNYNNEKRVRNDEKLMKAIHRNWAEFCKDAEGNGAASVHATVDELINNHEWFSEELKSGAHNLNAHYLNINL